MPTISPTVVTFASCPVPYKVLRGPQVAGSGSYTQGYQEQMTVAVTTQDLYAFLTWAGGQAYTISVGGVPVVRIIPVSHPLFQALICTNVTWKLTGAFNAAAATLTGSSTWTGVNTPTTTSAIHLQNYSWAQVTLTFSTVPYPVDGSRPFMVLNREIGAEVYTLAGQKLKFPSDGTQLDADAPITVPTIVYAATIYQAASVDDTTLAAAAAAPVSSTTFLGFAAGLVRFDGISSQTTMAMLSTAFQYTLKFTFRPVSWLQSLRPDGAWEAPTTPGGAYTYATSDLNALIQ